MTARKYPNTLPKTDKTIHSPVASIERANGKRTKRPNTNPGPKNTPIGSTKMLATERNPDNRESAIVGIGCTCMNESKRALHEPIEDRRSRNTESNGDNAWSARLSCGEL